MKFSKPLWKTLCKMWITPAKFPCIYRFFPVSCGKVGREDIILRG